MLTYVILTEDGKRLVRGYDGDKLKWTTKPDKAMDFGSARDAYDFASKWATEKMSPLAYARVVRGDSQRLKRLESEPELPEAA